MKQSEINHHHDNMREIKRSAIKISNSQRHYCTQNRGSKTRPTYRENSIISRKKFKFPGDKFSGHPLICNMHIIWGGL